MRICCLDVFLATPRFQLFNTKNVDNEKSQQERKVAKERINILYTLNLLLLLFPLKLLYTNNVLLYIILYYILYIILGKVVFALICIGGFEKKERQRPCCQSLCAVVSNRCYCRRRHRQLVPLQVAGCLAGHLVCLLPARACS